MSFAILSVSLIRLYGGEMDNLTFYYNEYLHRSDVSSPSVSPALNCVRLPC
jgi:hypothetical protein